MMNKIRELRSAAPVFGIFLTLTAFAVSANVMPPLITTIAAKMAVNYASFGLIIMLQFVSFFLAAVVGGWMCERFHITSRAFVVVGLAIMAATLLSGFTLAKASWFALWAIPLGVGGGLVETFGSIMVSDNDKPNSSKLLNLSQVFYCMGAISASPLVALLLYRNIAWQTILLVAGVVIVLILGIFAALTRNMSRSLATAAKVAENAPAPLLKDLLFFFLAAMLLMYVTIESMAACWVSVYFEKRLSCPAHASALCLSVFWIGLLWGRLAVTVIPRRFTLWWAMFMGTAVMVVGACCASFIRSPLSSTVLVFVYGLGSGPIWPTTVAICTSARNRPKFTSAVIAVGALGVALGSAFGSIIFKYVGAHVFFPAITLGAVLLLGLAFCSYKRIAAQAH